ncbi:glycosyltransferase [Virgibacillus sp. W0181]
MDKSTLVSIIVPIYNAEKVLDNCLSSVLNQTYSDLEIILVNDGSTDQSGDICDAYALKDSRMKVIHQLNAGPSSARNEGVQASTGDFIQFVDADDTVEPDLTEKLVAAMEAEGDIDFVICGYTIRVNGETGTIRKILPAVEGILNRSTFLNEIGKLYYDIVLPSLWNKLYVSDIIKSRHIQFREDLSMGEDLLFNLAYIENCQRVNIIRDPLYLYSIENNHSLSSKFNKNLFQNQLMLYQEIKRFLQKNVSYSGANKEYVQLIFANSIVLVLNNLFHPGSDLSATQKKKTIHAIISNKEVRENIPFFKDRMQARLIGVLIKRHSYGGIYSLLRLKYFTEHRMYPLFRMVKKVN